MNHFRNRLGVLLFFSNIFMSITIFEINFIKSKLRDLMHERISALYCILSYKLQIKYT